MSVDLIHVVKQFLLANYQNRRPLLLAFSGGPDSRALFEALCCLKKEDNVDFHIAHVDHGFRKESRQEAELLQKLAADRGIPFHLHTLSPLPQQKNIEAIFREARYRFFSDLQQQFLFEAVLVAHQQDDLAETVLKRILEGAHLYSISGMSDSGKLENLTIWRPLLSLSKKAIMQWLDDNNFPYLIDSSNADPYFLRARMRQSILPYLESNFGKNIIENLTYTGRLGKKLFDYLHRKTLHLEKGLVTGPFGTLFDTTLCDIDIVELEFFIHNLGKRLRFSLKRHSINSIVEALVQKKANKFYREKDAWICIDRGRLFFLDKQLIFSGRLLKGYSEQVSQPNWLSLFLGMPVSIGLVENKYEYVLPPSLEDKKMKTKIDRARTEAKVPAFLRSQIGVILLDGKLVYDFLSDTLFESSLQGNAPYQLIID